MLLIGSQGKEAAKAKGQVGGIRGVVGKGGPQAVLHGVFEWVHGLEEEVRRDANAGEVEFRCSKAKLL